VRSSTPVRNCSDRIEQSQAEPSHRSFSRAPGQSPGGQYPAQASRADAERSYHGARTEQEAREVQGALADYFGIPRFLVSDVADARTSAVFDAPVTEDAGRFPVIVFSPGLTGVRTSNIVLAQESATSWRHWTTRTTRPSAS